MRNHRSRMVVRCLLFVGATVLSLTSGCTGSTAHPPVGGLGEASQSLDEAQCVYFDVNGTDTICHHTSSVSHPYTLIKISDQGCINGHAAHAADYITSLDPQSSLYDPTCSGQGCLPAAAPCDGTLDCCTGSCVSGTCVDPGPALGCHDDVVRPASDDLFYDGPIDTIDNVRFSSFGGPRDGTCSGLSAVGAALITAASAADAATKCQTLVSAPTVIDGSFWNGVAGFWVCVPSASCERGICVCACTDVFDPVCDVGNGAVYANQCRADCAGAQPSHIVPGVDC